jgi:hypothetical protein
MGRVSPIISTFDSGEWAPEMYGRVDIEKYPNSCRRLVNQIALAHGPATRRPGTRFVAQTKLNAVGRMIPFQVSTDKAYQIEATPMAFRFYRDRGRLENPVGTPVELATPYGAGDLAGLKFAQDQNTLYLCSPTYQQRKVTRLSAVKFKIEAFDFLDGPYLEQNVGPITLTPSASAVDSSATITAAPNSKAVTAAVNNGSGAIRLTVNGHSFGTGDPALVAGVTGATEANGAWTVTKIDANTIDLNDSVFGGAYISGGTVSANLFAATDIGRVIRIKNGTTWGWAKITAYTNCYTVTALVRGAFAATTPTANWRLGAWSDTTGWPSCCTFFEERLWFADGSAKPQTLWGSAPGDYPNFAPSAADGTVTADHALNWTIADDRVNKIVWLSAGRFLNIGTVGGEFTVQASNLNEGLTPTNITVRRDGTTGSADIQAIRIGNAVHMVQRARKKTFEENYSYQDDAFLQSETSLLSRHLTRGKINSFCYQQEPWSIIWHSLDSGLLVGVTYLRAQQKLAWHRHPLGGTNAKVLSVSNNEADEQDECWMIVERTINGQTFRSVEFMEYEFEPDDENDKADCFFVDCGGTYSGAPVTTITGATWLAGATVQILADGAAHPDCTVAANGSFTLERAASKVQFGFGYISELLTQDLEGGSAEGSSAGKPKRIPEVTVRFKDTLGARVGYPAMDGQPEKMELVEFRGGSDPMDASPPLFTGDKVVPFPKGWSKGAFILVRQDQPLPMTVLALAYKMITMEG